MKFINDIHFQFTELVKDNHLKPYAYLLSKRLDEGNICIDLNAEDLGVEYESWTDEVKELLPEFSDKGLSGSAILSNSPEDKKPFIVFNNKFYSYRYFNYETEIINKIKRFIEQEDEVVDSRQTELESHKDFVSTLQDTNLDITDWQLTGCLNAYLNNFSIITGGPGTGKTTTIAKLLALLYTTNPNLKVALAAPTGKAAIRMLESLKGNALATTEPLKDKIEELEASTIHRLLGTIKNSPFFKHNEDNHLDFDVVIVDEASMIDVPLFAKLLSAMDPSKRLILLGDKNQLASVEAGSIFGDLCNSSFIEEGDSLNAISENRIRFINPFLNINNSIKPGNYSDTKLLHNHITELILNRRISEEAKVIEHLSKAIMQEDDDHVLNLLQDADNGLDLDIAYTEAVFENFISSYKVYINEPDIKTAIEKLNSIRVLCAVREGKRGIYAINKKTESYFQKKGLLKPSADDYHNRPILVTQNNKELDLYNGDIGVIRRNGKRELTAYFLDKNQQVREVIPSFIGSYETVFAMTIHKSQGSEFNEVLVVLPDKTENRLLTKELFYTAITRAKNRVVIQGLEEIIRKTVKTRVHRVSGIIDRINN